MISATVRPMEKGGWRCLKCNREVPGNHTYGVYHGNVFEVTGYRCECGHKWLNPEKKLMGAEPWNPYRLIFSMPSPRVRWD